LPIAFPPDMTRTLVPSAFALLVLSVSATLALLGAAPAPIVQPALGGAPWTDDAIVKLDAELEAMLATSPALRGAHYGVLAIDTATGNVLYDHAADSEFQPASTLKLLVGSAALEKLGAAYRFRTELADLDRDGAPIAGAFILVAGGDPTLATQAPELSRLYTTFDQSFSSGKSPPPPSPASAPAAATATPPATGMAEALAGSGK